MRTFNGSFLLAPASAHHIFNAAFVIQCSTRTVQQSPGIRYHWISPSLTLQITPL